MKYKGPKTNHVQNGLLLRADLHVLFDLRLLQIDSQLKIRLDRSLLHSSYAEFEGKKLRLPTRKNWQPSRGAIARHRSAAGPGT